jgi:hypothetical protein
MNAEQDLYFRIRNTQFEIRQLENKINESEGDLKLAYSTIKATHVSTCVGLSNLLNVIMISTIASTSTPLVVDNSVGQ